MGPENEAQAYMGSEVPWRAEPPFWSQNLIPVVDTKGSLWERVS